MYGLWSNISNVLICYLREVELTDYLDCKSIRRNHFFYLGISDFFFMYRSILSKINYIIHSYISKD